MLITILIFIIKTIDSNDNNLFLSCGIAGQIQIVHGQLYAKPHDQWTSHLHHTLSDGLGGGGFGIGLDRSFTICLEILPGEGEALVNLGMPTFFAFTWGQTWVWVCERTSSQRPQLLVSPRVCMNV